MDTETLYNILRVIKKHKEYKQTEIIKSLDYSVGTIRKYINILLDLGYISLYVNNYSKKYIITTLGLKKGVGQNTIYKIIEKGKKDIYKWADEAGFSKDDLDIVVTKWSNKNKIIKRIYFDIYTKYGRLQSYSHYYDLDDNKIHPI